MTSEIRLESGEGTERSETHLVEWRWDGGGGDESKVTHLVEW
jgi:hypothetical protein